MKYWSKSVLSIYRYLDSMSNSIDKIVLETGKKSNSYEIIKYQTTYQQANKMIELIDRKRKMINLKVICEDVLSRLTRNSRRILVLSFLDGVKSELIAKLLNVSMRTFFRKKINAINEFGSILAGLGYDSNYFEAEYSDEKWFMSVYGECIMKFNTDEEILDAVAVKRMLSEIGKISIYSNLFMGRNYIV